MSEEPGTRVLAGRYRLITRLGQHVLRGWDLQLSQLVAVRMLPADGTGVERASGLADLTHPGLVRVLDVGNDDGEPFLIEEFIAGTPLSTRLADGPLPPDTVGQIGVMLARALAYAHSRGVAHRDVRPGTILLGPGDEPYLTDLGIAESPAPAYMAPEQVDGAPPGPATDIYALGLVLLESLTGRPEYPGTDAASMRVRLTHPPRISPELKFAATIEAMTAAKPTDRPDAATCADLLRGSSAKSRLQTRTVLIAAVAAAIVATGTTLIVNAPRPAAEPRQARAVEQSTPPPQRTEPQRPRTTITSEVNETSTAVTTTTETTVTTTTPPAETPVLQPVGLLPANLPSKSSPPSTATSTPWFQVILVLPRHPKKTKTPTPTPTTTTTATTQPPDQQQQNQDEED
jgi:serine/threonine protein kinase